MTREDKLMQQILRAIYWKQFTNMQRRDILEIIKYDENGHGAATSICDYLNIERRGNRAELTPIINNYLQTEKEEPK